MTVIVAVPMDSQLVIVVVPMDSRKLLWCRWTQGNCCGADGFKEIVAEPMYFFFWLSGLFAPPGHICSYIISGAGAVSGTPHPAV